MHKHNLTTIGTFQIFIAVFIITFAQTICGQTNANPKLQINGVAVLAAINDPKPGNFQKFAQKFKDERKELGTEIMKILSNPKASNLQKCISAYYLGEMRYTEAAGILAKEIQLKLDKTYDFDTIPAIAWPPAAEALVKIGNASISPLIQNLAESDDDNVRKSSLITIYRIDSGDKELTQFRLQKAMAQQQSIKAQERIKLAITELTELKDEQVKRKFPNK